MGWEFYEKHGFNILMVSSIVFIFAMWLFFTRRRKSGSYTSIDFNALINGNKPQARPKRWSGPPSTSHGEIECRRVLESFFNRPFPKARPDFLYNHIAGTSNLELDCYNSDLKLACEYDGAQHSQYIPYFHKTRESFHNQKYRDALKTQLCAQNGVHLIRISHTVPVDRIEHVIIDELRSLIEK